MFIRPALALYDRGFSVLVVNQRGHGFSTGRGEDFTLTLLTQDALDAAYWVRRNFSGSFFQAHRIGQRRAARRSGSQNVDGSITADAPASRPIDHWIQGVSG